MGDFTINNDNPLELRCCSRLRRDTTADVSKLDAFYRNALYKFSILMCNSEIMVYKCLNFFADNYDLGVSQVKTFDGRVFESYFDLNAKHQYNMIQLRYLLSEDGPLRDIESKWLVLPNLYMKWSSKLALFVYSEIKNAGAFGIIFHAEGPSNFGQVLLQETCVKVAEFPNNLYTIDRELEDDGF